MHGCFCSRAEARSFPDTFFFTARELKDAGLTKARIKEALIAHHSALLDRGMADLEDVSSDEEQPEEEEAAESDERREGGEGGAAIEGIEGIAVVQDAVVQDAVL